MSKSYAISLKRSTALLAALTFMAMLSVVNLASVFSTVGAEQLSERSITLSSTLPGTETSGSAGSETNGSDAVHTLQFDVATAGSIGGVQLLYCQDAIGGTLGCTAPVGLDLTGATLGTTTGITGFAKDSSTANQFRLAIGTPDAVLVGDTVEINIADVVNPTNAGTFFVRITTYDANTFTTDIDEGTVASSITEGITITTRVTETLGFSTTADTASGVPAEGTACDPLTGDGAIQLGDPTENTLSIVQAYDAYSAFRLYTNASNGVVVQYEGATLTKGSDDIDEIGAVAEFVDFGTEQFGLGVDTTGGGITEADTVWTTDTAGELELAAAYAGADGSIAAEGAGAEFAFVADTPTTLASSDVNFGGYVNCATGAVRYVANVSPLTPSGTYTTTIVYSAVPTY